MKKEFLFACALGLSLTVQAKGHLDITSYRYAGPYLVSRPLLVDSTDVNAKAWSAASLLKTPLSLDAVGQAPVSDADKLPSAPAEGYALHLMQFDLENTAYGKAKFNVSEVKDWQLYVDGKLTDKQEMALEPGTHEVVLKYLSAPGESVKPKVSVDSDGEFSLHQGHDCHLFHQSEGGKVGNRILREGNAYGEGSGTAL